MHHTKFSVRIFVQFRQTKKNSGTWYLLPQVYISGSYIRTFLLVSKLVTVPFDSVLFGLGTIDYSRHIFVLFFPWSNNRIFFSLSKSMLILTVYLHYLQLNKYEIVPFFLQSKPIFGCDCLLICVFCTRYKVQIVLPNLQKQFHVLDL